MRVKIILLAVLLNTYIIVDSSAQEMPLVYDIENTGADCPIPYLPSISELPKIQSLPDPFEWSDGRGRISNFSDWRCRRAEIKAEIEHYEIGEKPVRPDNITASYSGGTLTVNVTVNGNTLTLTSVVVLPPGDGPFPAVIGMGGSTGSLPPGIFTRRDIAQISFNYWQVMAHTQTRGSEPINKLYPDLTYIGAYSAWSWGVSRLIDGLELVSSDLKIDLKHLAVTGCSFAGKMALFAGALDERIALTIAQESGGGGYTTWRVSETLGNVETLGKTSSAWFIQDMFQFSGSVSKLPHDHHELMAMVAPRALLVLGNPDYEWLADESGYVGSKAAKEVWNALGVSDRFGYSIVGGHEHCALPGIQEPEVSAFVEKFLLGNTTVNTEISTSPYHTNLTPWITWNTPTLLNGSSYFGKTNLVYPPNLQKDLETYITLIWNKMIDAERYFIQLSTDPTFKEITRNDSTTSDTSITFTGLTKGKKYFWRVRVKNNEGSFGPWSNLKNFITAIALPASPQTISASANSGREDYVTLTWSRVENASSYYVQLSTIQSFISVLSSATTGDTSKALNGTSEGKKYYWRVQAKNIAGASPWSNVSDFVLILPPGDLVLNRSGLKEATLNWDDNSSVEDGYIIERKQDQQTNFSLLDTVEENSTSYVDVNVEQAQSYTYRIKAYQGSAESDYSNEASLILVGVNEAEQIPTEYSINQNYPNPFNPTTKIKFGLPHMALTRIIIYDLLGREIKTLLNEELETGYHEINVDAENLSSGVYLYRIQSGDFNQTKKMILIR